jgi:hypothetical protein
MSNRSKDKGSAGERECGKILSKHLGGNFQRVSGSGAFTGGKNAFRKEFMSETQIRAAKSDLITPDHLPKMVVETKWYADFTFHALLRDDEIPVLDGSPKQREKGTMGWIEQIMVSIDPGDVWFLCFKINRLGWFIGFDRNLKDEFELGAHVVRKSYILTDMEPFLDKNKDKITQLCQ